MEAEQHIDHLYGDPTHNANIDDHLYGDPTHNANIDDTITSAQHVILQSRILVPYV